MKDFKQGSGMFNWTLSNRCGLNGLKAANIGTRKTNEETFVTGYAIAVVLFISLQEKR